MEQEIKKNKKDEQHIVPRTYLKHWKISNDQNFVYGIDFSNIYKKGVQIFGLNHKVFKQRKYYNDNSLQNPYIIENVLGQDIEPNYDKIMNEVNSEINLSQPIREKIMQWLYISKMRSPYTRNSAEHMANFLFKTTERYKDKNLNPEKEKAIEQHSQRLAKEIQLKTFYDIEQVRQHLNLYIETLNAKHWRILKSIPQFQFWTNDNPGFSPNTVERFAKDTPYHHVMEMNSRSIILFPLSPKYCLEATPFRMGTASDINRCALNMEIKFVQVSPLFIEYINKGVLYTCSKLIISNSKNMLESCIQRK